MQRSLQVVGLAGMGTSNLLRFLVSHPQLVTDHNNFQKEDVFFLYIDGNKVRPANSRNFFRECLLRLQPEVDLSLFNDDYLLYKKVEGAIQSLDNSTFLVLVLDHFEPFYNKVEPEFFSQLRSLRDDACNGQLAFVIGGRHELPNLHDLDRLFSNTCQVKPLVESDWPAVVARHEGRLRHKVPEAWHRKLGELAGGHPGLLKNALEWLMLQEDEIMPSDEALIADLLNYNPLQKHCRQLWESLTPAEQGALRYIDESSDTGDEIIDQLIDYGILAEAKSLKIFSPIWQAYLQDLAWPKQGSTEIEVDIDSSARRVTLRWRGKNVSATITRDLVFSLLQTLSSRPGEIFTKDELLQKTYPYERSFDVMDDALFQLVTALRKIMDDLVTQLNSNVTESCVQNVRGVGYRLVLDLPIYQD